MRAPSVLLIFCSWLATSFFLTSPLSITGHEFLHQIGQAHLCAVAPLLVDSVISIAESIDFMQAAFCRVHAPAEALPAQYVKDSFAVQGGKDTW